MKRLIEWKHNLSTFIHREEGSALPMVGLGIMALLGATGIAVDMGRVQVAQSRMSNALDAAGLAAGANVNSIDLDAEVTKYFNANYPPAYLGSQVTGLTVTGNSDLTMLTLDSTGTVPTTFMKVFGIDSVPISAHTEITRNSTGLELVLVIDTTGSMDQSAGGGKTKIQAAKSAATTLVNILFGNKESQENLWVGMVPFAQAVNIGTARASWTNNTSVPSTPGWGSTTWMGCVDARETGNRDVTDDPPLSDGSGPDMRFPKYYWGCHATHNAWYGTNSNRNNCNTSPSGSLKFKTGLGTSLGPNKYCSQPIRPLTGSKSNMLTAINSLDTDGNTHIVLGAAWAWRMLSPRWRGLWGGEMDTNNLPLDYNTPLMNKAVVLMTDGDNTITSSVKGAYGYLSEGRLGTTNQSTAETRLDTRLQTVCTNMKNNGIIVYTVAFGTGISSTTQNMLRNCATQPDYYFYSPSGSDLEQAFRQIGDSLANLRISL